MTARSSNGTCSTSRSPPSTAARRAEIAEGNRRRSKGRYNFGQTTGIFHERYVVPPAKLAPGHYRNITGNEATALGFVAASKLAGRDLFYGSYPITPASDILHPPARPKQFRG